MDCMINALEDVKLVLPRDASLQHAELKRPQVGIVLREISLQGSTIRCWAIGGRPMKIFLMQFKTGRKV